MNADQNPQSGDDSAIRDLVLELNFVPNWARKPPTPDRYNEQSEDSRPSSRDRGRAGQHSRPPGGGGMRRAAGQSAFDRLSDKRGGRDRNERRGGYGGGEVERRAPPPRVPARVTFLPDQKQLAAMVRQLHGAKKAYPLLNLATLLASKPEFCCVKIEPARDAEGLELYQCRTCKMPALDRASLFLHALRTHFGDYFDKQETEGEAPTGQFVCVARCGLSGILLGPPNHHSYAGRLQEVHRTRYPGMPFDQYQASVQMCHDPNLIEQWRQESCRQTLYRLRQDQGAAETKALSWADAESVFQKKISAGLITRTQRAIVPLPLALQMEDQSLRQAVQEAWQREIRFPRSVALALRAAFKHKNLYLFKVGDGWDYVSPFVPSPLDPARAIPSIGEVLKYLQEHPGCKRKDLVESLRAGKALDSPEAAEVLSPLGWLIEKGHIIEFFDGALSVPLAVRSEGSPAAPPADPPA